MELEFELFWESVGEGSCSQRYSQSTVYDGLDLKFELSQKYKLELESERSQKLASVAEFPP